jgi:hypothetical protein
MGSLPVSIARFGNFIPDSIQRKMRAKNRLFTLAHPRAVYSSWKWAEEEGKPAFCHTM